MSKTHVSRSVTRKMLIAEGTDIKPLTRTERFLKGFGDTPLTVKEKVLEDAISGTGNATDLGPNPKKPVI